MPLSSGARSLLADMASDHGLGALDFDAEGLIPIDIDGNAMAIVYSEPRDSFFLMGLIALDAKQAMGGPWQALMAAGRLRGPRTRLAVEPDSGALVVVSEVFVLGTTYPELASALELFVADFTALRERHGGDSAEPKLGIADLFSSNEILIRI